MDRRYHQRLRSTVCGDGSLDQSADAFAGVFVHDRTNLECFALLAHIELEIHGPHHIRGGRRRRVDRGAANPFASTTLWHSEPFVTPQPLDFLMIDVSSVGPGIMIRPAIVPAWMIFSVLTQPGTQWLIRISHGVVVQGSAPCRSR